MAAQTNIISIKATIINAGTCYVCLELHNYLQLVIGYQKYSMPSADLARKEAKLPTKMPLRQHPAWFCGQFIIKFAA